MSDTIQMKITYMDGTSQTFEWERSVNESSPLNQVSQLQKGLSEEQILIEVEGQLVIIPKQNIKVITLNIAPSSLPSYAIKGAREVIA